MPNCQNLEVARAYLRALEQGACGDALARFFTDDAQQIELPNRLNPHGAVSDLRKLLNRAANVPHLIDSQRYEVISETVSGSHVILEAVWTGTLKIGFGSISSGTTMKAHIALFFEFVDGCIKRQRNYDCFEPW